jgi:hypothetical protein
MENSNENYMKHEIEKQENGKHEINKDSIHVLVYFHGLNIQDIYSYVGDKAADVAAAHFESLTGISYAEYQARYKAGEGNNEILSEDDEGTLIYVLNPTVCN